MSDAVPVQRRTKELNISPRFENYSKVIIHVDDENAFVAGDDSGRTLEIDNPFGSQELANRILAKLTGYQYQPYTADGALLDPAAEMGDAVTIKDVYGGLYKNSLTFSRLMAADIAAPADEEINHEFQFESPMERRYKRELGEVKASLMVKADEISALVESVEEVVDDKLDATGGTQSFGWTLLSNKWAVKANGKEVFTVDQNGGTFAGKVVASSGKIGGFEITATSIRNENIWLSINPWTVDYEGHPVPTTSDSYNDVFTVGSNFHVKADGSILATSGKFSGTLEATTIKGDIMINDNTYTPAQFSGGISGGFGAWGALTGSYMNSISLNSGVFKMNGHNVYLGTVYINSEPYNVLRWI